MKILSIDPATSTGFSVFEDGKLKEYGFFKPSGKKCETMNQKLYYIYNFFFQKIKDGNFDFVVVEDFKVGKFASAAESGYSIRAMFRLMTEQLNVKHEVINVTDWHKFLVGSTQATKKQKQELGKDALKIITGRKLRLVYEIDSSCMNHFSGKIKETPFDVYDSIGIGHYFLNKGFDK